MLLMNKLTNYILKEAQLEKQYNGKLVIGFFSLIRNSSSFNWSRKDEGNNDGNMRVSTPWINFSLVAQFFQYIKSRHKQTHVRFHDTVWDL